MSDWRAGVDLGGTKIEAALLDPQGRVRFRERIESPGAEGYRAMLAAAADMARRALAEAPGRARLGFGIPGSINARTDLVQNANSTCLIGHPLQRDLAALLGREIAVANDADCFTLAEARAGAGRGFAMVFGVIMGTGCGGGLALDGEVRQGPQRICGEWGHVSVDPAGAPCYCGNRGCVETRISGSGVERAFAARFGESRTMREIAAGARAGDPRCAEAFDQFLEDFGRCLGGLISVLDPDAVVLGGGLSNIDELYGQGRERVARYAFVDELATPILKNELGDSAGVIGAAWIGR